MIFLCPVDSGDTVYEQGLFISTEMGMALSRELASGKIRLDRPFVPVHLPYQGLLTMNHGNHDHLEIQKEKWLSMGLPPQYQGEDLTGRRLVVFPMHGLGDQMYLAVALRALSARYPGMEVVIVRPSIASAEQWYPLIYFESFYRITGPVVKTDEMKSFDFYLNAEHFAHVPEYNGCYPPEFYMSRFFFHPADLIGEPVPRISPDYAREAPSSRLVDETIGILKKCGKPLVFVNAVSTGRVRDLPLDTLMAFIASAQDRFAFLVSSFKRPDIEKALKALDSNHVRSTEGLIADVRDLCRIIARSDAVITVDSGITHLAEALARPCGSVFNVVTAEERTAPYKFSETLQVEFLLEGVCRTPCYVHALKDGDLCPGMAFINEKESRRLFYDYPPCVARLEGRHLVLLLDALIDTIGIKRGNGLHE